MVGAARLLAALALAGCALPVQAAGGPALFVANKAQNSLMVFDLASGERLHLVPSCANPHELALSPDGRHVALACYGGEELEIYHADGLELLKRIELAPGARPHGIVWHSNGAIYATGQGRSAVYVVEEALSDAPQVSEIVTSAEGGPHMLAVIAAADTLWGTNVSTGEVVRVDLVGKALTHTAKLGGNVEAIALSPDGSALWVGSNSDHKVFRLDPDTLEVLAQVPVGRIPIRLQVHPGGEYAVTSEFGTGSLSVIDTASNNVVRTIPVSGGQAAVQVTMFFSADGTRAYVAETGPGMVAEVDFASGEVLRRFDAGPGGDGLAVR